MPGLAASADPTLSGPMPRDAGQRAALHAIVAAAEDRKSFAAVTGKAGTGKTAVLGMAAALLDHPPIHVIRADASGEAMSSRRLIEQIAGPTDPDDPAAALETALERLLTPPPPCTRTILMIDDAHWLLDDALAYLQLTSGLEEAAGLQIVFAGRPEFGLLCQSDLLGKLRERIGFRATLDEPPAVGRSPRPAGPPAEAVGGGAAAAPEPSAPGPNQAVVPHRQPLRLLPAPYARRWTVRQYGLTSALAATVVLASLWPVARDRIHAPPSLHTAAQAAISGGSGPSPQRVLLAAPPVPRSPEPRPKALPAPPLPVRVRTEAAEAIVNLGKPLIAVVSGGADSTAQSVVQLASLATAPAEQAATDAPAPPAAAKDSAPAPAPPPRAEGPAPAAPAPAAPASTAPASVASTSAASAPAAAPGKPVAKPSPAEGAPPSPPTLSADMIASLASHGDDMLRQGDIGAARLLYARAAEAGSSAAAVAMGKTFDPRFLADMRTEGIAPDPQAAALWYRRALALGDHDAARLLARLSDNPAP